MKIGRNGKLYVSGSLDNDGEIEIEVTGTNGAEDATEWLTKEDAIALVATLQKTFGI